MTDRPPDLRGRSGGRSRRSLEYRRDPPRSREVRLVRRLPFALTATASLLTAILLLPMWVVAAIGAGTIGVVRSARAQTPEEHERSETMLSFALGCSIGPIVYLLLAGIAAATG